MSACVCRRSSWTAKTQPIGWTWFTRKTCLSQVGETCWLQSYIFRYVVFGQPLRFWSYVESCVHRSYSFNFRKPYLWSFKSSPREKSLKNAKCSTLTCKCGTFFSYNKQVCQLLIFWAQQACVPPLSVPPRLFSCSVSRCANLRCATCFFFSGTKQVCHREGCASWRGKLCTRAYARYARRAYFA